MDTHGRIIPNAHLPDDRKRIDWLSVLQLGSSALAMMGLWGLSLMTVFGFGMMLVEEGAGETLGATIAGSAALFFTGVLALISAGLAARRLIKPEADPWVLPEGVKRWMSAYRWAALLPVVWLAAVMLPEMGAAATLIFPLVNILGIGLPVWLAVSLAKRKLPAGSGQRQWGLFTSGMVFATAPILILELLAGVFLVAAAILLNPGLMQALMGMLEGGNNIEIFELERLVSAHIEEADVLAFVGVYIAFLVPLIEELLKPIGVWLLAGRKLTPAAGFAAGAVSGAGFALFESLLGSADPSLWPNALLARAGTAAMHTLASGISGWGLAHAFTYKRYGRALLSYLAAVGLHASWNAVPVIVGAAALAEEVNGSTLDIGQLEGAAAGLFAIMGLAALALLVYINRRLAGGAEAPTGDEATAEAAN